MGSRWLGPLAADLDGDGGNEVVVAGQDGSGRALLIAYRFGRLTPVADTL